MDDVYEIALATKYDIEAVLDLQERNLPERGGTLSARLTRAWFETAIGVMPVIVAKRRAGGGLSGIFTLAAFAEVSVAQAMLEAYRGASDAYVYGPICVAEIERGRGIANRMLAALRARLPGREGVLFIRRDNVASLRAHARMGMREVTGFEHDDTMFVVLSCIG